MHGILVAYGSRYGSTRRAADVIADALQAHGTHAVVMEADNVLEVDLEHCPGVIVGGGIYGGFWHGHARKLAKRLRRHPEIPVAAFALGPLNTRQEKPKEWDDALARLGRALAHQPDGQVRESRVFGGVIDPDRMHFPFNRMPQVDLLDEADLRSWAVQAASSLERTRAAAGHVTA